MHQLGLKEEEEEEESVVPATTTEKNEEAFGVYKPGPNVVFLIVAVCFILEGQL